MEALKRLGIAIVPFDTTPYLTQGFRFEQTLAHRFQVGRGPSTLNVMLRQTADMFDTDGVWIDKGVWIYPETLAYIKDRTRRYLAIHYTPDAQLTDNRSRHFERCLPLYDLAVTTKPFEKAAYRLVGAPRVLLVMQGYGAHLVRDFKVPVSDARVASEVCFIGHCQPHYAQQLRAAASTCADLRIWGANWPRYAKSNRWARTYVRGDGLYGEDYTSGLASAKIALGLLSKRIPETTTTRTFEIPACGTFMLAERTEAHEMLFEEGVEAEFFGSRTELCDKIRYYLAHDDARKRIAGRGQQRCLRSGYSEMDQLRLVLDELADVLGDGAWRSEAA